MQRSAVERFFGASAKRVLSAGNKNISVRGTGTIARKTMGRVYEYNCTVPREAVSPATTNTAAFVAVTESVTLVLPKRNIMTDRRLRGRNAR